MTSSPNRVLYWDSIFTQPNINGIRPSSSPSFDPDRSKDTSSDKKHLIDTDYVCQIIEQSIADLGRLILGMDHHSSCITYLELIYNKNDLLNGKVHFIQDLLSFLRYSIHYSSGYAISDQDIILDVYGEPSTRYYNIEILTIQKTMLAMCEIYGIFRPDIPRQQGIKYD